LEVLNGKIILDHLAEIIEEIGSLAACLRKTGTWFFGIPNS
jgi:hypothetical protein